MDLKIVSSKSEIQEKLRSMSDFLQIDYLERCSKEGDLDLKKFCHSRLAKLYESKNMFTKAAENMESVAGLSRSSEEKVDAYTKAAKLLIEGGDYLQAESLFTKAFSFIGAFKKVELKKEIIRTYQARAEELEKEMKRASAVAIYERILQLGDEIDKREARRKLENYYEKLGKIRELNILRSSNRGIE